MRVTELTKHNAVNKNLNTNSEELQNLMIGISNGKVLNKPSDDPVGAAKVQDFRTSINHSKTLEKNISADKVWLNSNEETVKQIVETLMYVKDLALEGANGSSTAENRSTLAHELELITKNLIDLGNKKEGKLYLFSGTKTFTKPLSENPKILEPTVTFYGTRIKSNVEIIPINQDKPLKGISPGTFTIHLEESPEYLAEARINTINELGDAKSKTPPVLNKDGEPVDQADKQLEPTLQAEDLAKEEMTGKKIQIDLTGTESIKEIVNKINKAAIAEGDYSEDPHSPIGYKTKIVAEIGVDNAIYLDPAKGINVKFGEDTTCFLECMNFEIMGAPGVKLTEIEQGAEIAGYSEIELNPLEYEAEFVGYAKDKYLVRVIKGGTYGIAQVIISDDDGKTWSQPKVLNQTMEVFNPEGKASNKVDLVFKANGQPFFKEGLEFQYNGNEFISYEGNEQIKEVVVDNGIKVALNINAKQLFKEEPGNEDTVDIFDMLNRLSEALNDDDQQSVMKSIGDIDKSINQVLKIRSQIGSVFRELESSEERIQQNMDFKMDELSKLEDMDLAKGAVDLNKAELKQRTALDASARLIQPTLIDFLR